MANRDLFIYTCYQAVTLEIAVNETLNQYIRFTMLSNCVAFSGYYVSGRAEEVSSVCTY